MVFLQENLVTFVSMWRELLFERLLVISRPTETRCFRLKWSPHTTTSHFMSTMSRKSRAPHSKLDERDIRLWRFHRKKLDCTLSPRTIATSQNEAFLTIGHVTWRGSVADGYSWHKHKNATDLAWALRLVASAGPPITRPLARGAEKQMVLLGVEIQPENLTWRMTRRKTVKTKDKMENRCTLGVTEVKTVTPRIWDGTHWLQQHWRTHVFPGKVDSCNQFKVGGFFWRLTTTNQTCQLFFNGEECLKSKTPSSK